MRYLIITACFLLAFGAPAHAAPDGAALYAQRCAVCHGEDGRGGVGVPLALESFLNGVDDRFLRDSIRHGRPGRVMPAFPSLSDAQLDAIVSHIRSWSERPAPMFIERPVVGDAVHGKALYGKYCAQCHGEAAGGGQGTGVTFSRHRKLPIIAPALNNPGFLASASDEMIKHTLMLGREGTPMSSFLVHGLKEDDIDDLVSFIRSMQGAAAGAADQGGGEPLEPVLSMESSYGFDETVDNVIRAIESNNFKFIRRQPLEQGLAEPGAENGRQEMIYFCNFNFLFEALALDPRVGMFLPCRITVTERDGRVMVMSINPMRLSRLFNNEELDEACKTMRKIYADLLEEATL